MTIKNSELIINADSSIYHLGLKPHMMVENVIVVGDPDRVELVASHFDVINHKTCNREYKTVVGEYKGKPVMVISSGIGCGAVDILINELDALVNIDFENRRVKDKITKLNIVRIGTTGALVDDIALGDAVMSRYTVGIDGLAHFYEETSQYRDKILEQKFHNEIFDNSIYVLPYAIESSLELVDKYASISKQGITMCAGGFFAPQGRRVRLKPTFDILDKLARFSYKEYPLTNIEMEGAALESLAIAMGHNAITICVAIAHRTQKRVNISYKEHIERLVVNVLDKL